jgi:hypothetical protein
MLAGRRRFSNYSFGRLFISFGSVFCYVGRCFYCDAENCFSLTNERYVQFWPQGFVIAFYGTIGIVVGIYLLLIRFFGVGSGFNEYNCEKEEVRIFRLGIPLKNRYREFSYPFSELEALSLENKSGLTKSATFDLFLRLKGERKILITTLGSENIQVPKKIEYFSTKLARFLKLPLESKSLKIFKT